MKKTTQNDVTGDWLHSKPNNEMFEEGWERIFGKKKVLEELDKTIRDNQELLEAISDIEYELDKSTGEVIKKDSNV